MPKLNTWIFTEVRNQVVSGEINCFKFKEFVSQNVEEYCVWSQIWNNNFMELSLPNGSKITQGGSQAPTSPSPIVSTPQSNGNLMVGSANPPAPAPASAPAPTPTPVQSSPGPSGAQIVVGGFSQSNTQALSTLEKGAQDFLLRMIPMLSSWTLINVRTQIVAG